MYCRWTHFIKPEDTALNDAELLQSLNSIHGWPDFIGPAETGLIKQCIKACATPLEELLITDLNTLVMQKIGLETLSKIAIPIVELCPWIEAEFYPGDLLSCLINADEEINNIDSALLQRVAISVRRLLAMLREDKLNNILPERAANDAFGNDDFNDDLAKFLSKWSGNYS